MTHSQCTRDRTHVSDGAALSTPSFVGHGRQELAFNSPAASTSLAAGIDIAPNQRPKLERLCRFVSRLPMATERMALTSSGHVRYQLKTPYRDGTMHIVIEDCARCGGKLATIVSIDEPEVIPTILAHLEQTAPDQSQPELLLGARAPPSQMRGVWNDG